MRAMAMHKAHNEVMRYACLALANLARRNEGIIDNSELMFDYECMYGFHCTY